MPTRKVTMAEAVDFMSKRTMIGPIDYRSNPEPNVTGDSKIRFTDGSEVSVTSDWSGPYSELTPDIDGDPPIWEIYEPEKKG